MERLSRAKKFIKPDSLSDEKPYMMNVVVFAGMASSLLLLMPVLRSIRKPSLGVFPSKQKVVFISINNGDSCAEMGRILETSVTRSFKAHGLKPVITGNKIITHSGAPIVHLGVKSSEMGLRVSLAGEGVSELREFRFRSLEVEERYTEAMMCLEFALFGFLAKNEMYSSRVDA